jgi:hypothetical protein
MVTLWPRKKHVLIECSADAPINPVVSEIAFDEFSIEIVGPADAVRRMSGWLQYSLQKVDYRDLIVPMLRPTNGIEFSLIGKETWRISVSVEGAS